MLISKEQYEFLKRIDSETIGFVELQNEKKIYNEPKYHNLVLNLKKSKYFAIAHDYYKVDINPELFNTLSAPEKTRLMNAASLMGYTPYVLTQSGIEALSEYNKSIKDFDIKDESIRISKEAINIAEKANKKASNSNILQFVAIIISIIALVIVFFKG